MADRFTWTQPQRNTDGTAFNASQYAGYEFEIDGAPVVSVPVAWDTDGDYELSFSPFGFGDGDHSARVRVKHVNGSASDYSGTVTFTTQRIPEAPTGFSVA